MQETVPEGVDSIQNEDWKGPRGSGLGLFYGLYMLGMNHVPVQIGTDGGSTKHTDTFSDNISAGMTGIDYISGTLRAVASPIVVTDVSPSPLILSGCIRQNRGANLMKRYNYEKAK